VSEAWRRSVYRVAVVQYVEAQRCDRESGGSLVLRAEDWKDRLVDLVAVFEGDIDKHGITKIHGARGAGESQLEARRRLRID
jgi:hypothetical protein